MLLDLTDQGVDGGHRHGVQLVILEQHREATADQEREEEEEEEGNKFREDIIKHGGNYLSSSQHLESRVHGLVFVIDHKEVR